MKAIKLFSILAVSCVMILSSCSRVERNCQCCGGLMGGCQDITVSEKSRKLAKKECEQLSNPSNVPDGYQCELK